LNIKYPKRIALANLPTRIEKLARLSDDLEGPEIYIKRDDLTECGASGNKIRKLEFVIADAIENGADTLITCGWTHSNHARATAIIAARLGMKCVLVLRGTRSDQYEGNLFLDKLMGAEVRYVTPEDYERRYELMEEITEELKNKDRKGYPIPSGATNELGLWGYIKAAQEINEQLKHKKLKIDAIITPVGTGGVYAGLIIGKAIFDLDSIIYGVNVEENEAYFKNAVYELVEKWQKKYGTDIKIFKEDIKIIDGYVGLGYGISSLHERETIKMVAQKEGIILDPVYTGKAFHGLIEEIKRGRFKKGEKVLFIHTGGIFGLIGAANEFEL
jgi:D-cysteine desulfhydrase